VAGRQPNSATDRRRWGNALWRPFLVGLGVLCVVIGIAGLFLPLLPGTLFLIIAAACFTRSSPRFERWLLDHPRLGPPVRRWRKTGVIPPIAKAAACTSLVVSYAIVLTSEAPGAVKVAMLPVLGGVAVYILTRPSA
jgi:uncharacterized membrane protein YbaN (DUF454 family)